jgi:outer membrane biosynthesis protein TonB
LIQILAKRFRLSDEEIVLLNDKSVLDLEIYAKDKGFNISIDLKKSDMVEFIVFSLGMYHQEAHKDLHDYHVPLAVDLDTVQIEEVEFVSNDQDIPVLNAQPVKEEPVKTEPEPEPVPVSLEEEVVAPKEAEPEPQPLPEPEPEPTPQPEPEPNRSPNPHRTPTAIRTRTPTATGRCG